MSTIGQTVKSAMIALTGRTAFLRFYHKMSGKPYTSVLRSWIYCRIIWVEYSKLSYLSCLCTPENLLNTFIVQYHKDLLICFLVQNHFKFCTFNNSSCLITVLLKKIFGLKQKIFFCYPSNLLKEWIW